MNDILREIQQDIDSEKYQRIFLEHGKKLIAAAVIILIVVAAKSLYWSAQKKESLKSGELFVEAFDNSEPSSYDAIIANKQKGYAPLALLMKAGLENSHEKYDDAVKTLEQLENSSYDKAFIDMAKLNKAYVLIQQKGDKAKILQSLDAISTEGSSPFWATATELKASYLLSQGENKPAAELLRKLAINNQIPSTIQDRAKQVLSTINE